MKIVFYFLIPIMISTSFSQSYKQIKINSVNSQIVNQISSLGIDLEHSELTKDNSLIFFVSDEEFKNITSSGISYEVQIDDWISYYESLPKLTETEKNLILEDSRQMYNVDGFDFGSMGGFYTYQEVVAELDSMFLNYPSIITEKYSIGTTTDGRTVWAVKISDNPNVNENEPSAGFDALIHAREPQSMATLMYFMYYLLENYGTDPEVTYLVNNREIYCVPVYNPDGYEFNRQNNPNGGGLWRKNRRNNGGSFGVDLNRNYSFKWGYDNSGSSPTPSSETYRGPSAFSEPETQAVRDLINSKSIMTYFNMHAWQNAFLYPWGYTDLHTPDSLTYIEFASDMSSYNDFSFGLGSQVLGYNSNGSARDWLYGEQVVKNKIFGYTMEIGNSSDNFWPPQNRIFPLAQINLKALMYNTWVAGDYVSFLNADYNQMYFNAGDNVEMTVELKNKGLSTAYNITAELISLSGYAVVNSGSTSVDSIEARSSSLSSSPFTFNITSTAPLEEEIKFVVKVYTNSVQMSEDTVSIIIGVPEYIFADTSNNINNLWTISSSPLNPKWESTTTSFYSSPNSYTDSKSGNYANSATVTMTLTNPVDLSLYTNPKLTFWTKYDIEGNWDYGQVEISTNNGSTWIPLQGNYTEPGTGSFQPNGQPVYDGTQSNWVHEQMSLSSYTSSQVKIRFELKTDGFQTRDGWYVDDIGILVYTSVPVELASFTADVSAEGVSLKWKTASELNNRGFEIQKSKVENQKSKTEWKSIGFVEGYGTTTEVQNYSFTDAHLSDNGIFQYRLKQIDFDGSFKIYDPVEVEYGIIKDYTLEQNYPNPFNPETIIKYSIPNSGRVIVKIFNILGKEIKTLVDENQEAGSYEIKFNSEGLSSGVYFYKLESGEFLKLRKMILLR